MSFAAQFGFEVEGVGAVEGDVVVLGECQVRRVFVGDGVALVAQGVEGVAEVGRGPEHGGVGDTWAQSDIEPMADNDDDRDVQRGEFDGVGADGECRRPVMRLRPAPVSCPWWARLSSAAAVVAWSA